MTSALALPTCPPPVAVRAPAPARPGTAPRRFWPRALGGLLLLAAEVGALTPFVEFSSGPIQHVANARVCAALLFALVAFLFLAGGATGRQFPPAGASRPGRALAWLSANLALYAVFFLYNVGLEGGLGRWLPPSVAVPAWLLLAGAAGLTSFLAFFPPRLLWSWAWRCRTKALLAAALGGCLALITAWVQGLWPRVAGPTLSLDRVLLARTYGQAVSGQTWDGVPVVGTRRLLLLVTPGCSEMDALAAFWLLAAAVLCARWREVRKVRLALVLPLGTALLYLLNVARIYGLAVVGTSVSPKVCVSLAHSRIGGALFLAVTAVLLSFTLRPRRSPALPTVAENRKG
jgi:exosortase/archaeosortase family protein